MLLLVILVRGDFVNYFISKTKTVNSQYIGTAILNQSWKQPYTVYQQYKSFEIIYNRKPCF